MLPASPPRNGRGAGGSRRLSALIGSLATAVRRRNTADRPGAGAAQPTPIDESGIDSPAYQQWLRHLHRTTADTFDDDSAEE